MATGELKTVKWGSNGITQARSRKEEASDSYGAAYFSRAVVRLVVPDHNNLGYTVVHMLLPS